MALGPGATPVGGVLPAWASGSDCTHGGGVLLARPGLGVYGTSDAAPRGRALGATTTGGELGPACPPCSGGAALGVGSLIGAANFPILEHAGAALLWGSRTPSGGGGRESTGKDCTPGGGGDCSGAGSPCCILFLPVSPLRPLFSPTAHPWVVPSPSSGGAWGCVHGVRPVHPASDASFPPPRGRTMGQPAAAGQLAGGAASALAPALRGCPPAATLRRNAHDAGRPTWWPLGSSSQV